MVSILFDALYRHFIPPNHFSPPHTGRDCPHPGDHQFERALRRSWVLKRAVGCA